LLARIAAMTKAQAPVPHAKDEFPTPGHPRANSECRDHLNHLQNNSMGIPHTDSTDFPFLVVNYDVLLNDRILREVRAVARSFRN
jgi:hypothetical protein